MARAAGDAGLNQPPRRGAAPHPRPRLASGNVARSKSGLLRRIGRIALYGVIGFLIGSIVLVALYRALPPPVTPLMLIRRVEGYGIDKSWRRLDKISPHLIRAAIAGEDAMQRCDLNVHASLPVFAFTANRRPELVAKKSRP